MTWLHKMVRAPESEGAGGGSAPAPTTAPAPSPSPTPAPEQTHDYATDAAKAVFDFDPFDKGNKPSPSTQGAPPAGGADTVQGATPAPTPAQTPPPLPPQGPDPIIERLDQIARHTAPQEQRQPEGPQVNVPDFRFQLPDQITRLMLSEDPRERIAGVQAFGSGIARMSYRQAVLDVRQEIAAVLPHFVTKMIKEHSEQRTVFDDFYGTYKNLNNPRIYPVVRSIAETMLPQYHGQWTPQFKEALAEAVYAELRAVTGAAPPAGAGSGASPAPPVLMPTGVRPGSNGALSGEAKDIADLVFG